MKLDVKKTRDTLTAGIRSINRQLRDLPKEAYDVFRDETPVRTGNARSRTKLQGNVIVADYPYAQRLDQGYSKQAPKGMSEPTLAFIEQRVDKIMRGL